MNKYIESDCTHQGVLRLKAFFASEVYRGGMRVSKKDVSPPDGRNNILVYSEQMLVLLESVRVSLLESPFIGQHSSI